LTKNRIVVCVIFVMQHEPLAVALLLEVSVQQRQAHQHFAQRRQQQRPRSVLLLLRRHLELRLLREALEHQLQHNSR
jgi:hypothetical protein